MKHNTLQKGDMVAIISPSANIIDNPEARELCQKGEKMLTDMGLKVVYSSHWDDKCGYKSGTLEERIADIEEVFGNPDIKAVICTQGGDNSNELLEYINWDIIKNSDVRFFGLSDITVLLNAIYAKTGKVTYHGIDLIWGLGKNATDFTKENLTQLFFNGTVSYEPHREYPRRKAIRVGEGSGVCLGGCLPSFALLMGTEYDPLKHRDEDFILIIESIGESFSRIESYVAQISQQDAFKKHCKGIIVGYFFLCQEEIEENNRTVSDIIIDYTHNLSIPVVEIMELGHAVENIIFPIGQKITIKADEKSVTFKEEDLTI